MMGLRLARGVARDDFRRTAGSEIEHWVHPDRLSALVEENLVQVDPAGIRCTPAGRQRLNAVLAHLIGCEAIRGAVRWRRHMRYLHRGPACAVPDGKNGRRTCR